MSGDRSEGQVVHWNKVGVYGFLRPDHGDRDVFFHLDGCETNGEEPRVGDRVSFVTAPDRKPGKICAKEVRFVGDDAPGAPAGMFKAPEEVVSGAALADWLTRDQK
jgi:CspA family cold shock protein